MAIDMDYMLCIPAVHAVCAQGFATVDMEGNVRDLTGTFPDEKLALLKKWAVLHRTESVK